MEKGQLFVTIALNAWDQQVKRITAAFNKFTDESLFIEIAPGKNRLLYVLGHLTAVNDTMLPLLSLGERLYPHLEEAFIRNPDKATAGLPKVSDLRACWVSVNEVLWDHFKKLSPDEWLMKHNSISAEDFEKEPHRNRLSVLLSRTNHVAYHWGQIVLVKE